PVRFTLENVPENAMLVSGTTCTIAIEQ
ncbi:MAG TPA: HlyD family secretion protein, partial [Atlantibacter hermannii]|nr:HlyD family secretion protein [Atlantibacter hermannii]